MEVVLGKDVSCDPCFLMAASVLDELFKAFSSRI